MDPIQPYSPILPMVEFTRKKQERLASNLYPPPDEKTQKILEKVKNRLGKIGEQVNEERLQECMDKIRWRIERHAPQRIVVYKNFDLSLFNANKNPADISDRVKAIRDQLHKAFFAPMQDSPNLRGRVLKQEP